MLINAAERRDLEKKPEYSISSKKCKKLPETIYSNNKKSDYTEKIKALDNLFDYESQRSYYWGPAELSTFYGTPLYDQASSSQKLALNHLYWVTQYNQTAATEANAILYNQVTEGLFSAIKGCDILCQELSLETAQEHYHIHAFHTVGYRVKRSLFGLGRLQKPRKKISKSHKIRHKSGKPHNYTLGKLQEYILHLISSQRLKNNSSKLYSDYLKTLEEKKEPVPIQTTGLLGQVIPPSLSQLMTVSFGTSPFLACFFYATRYLANILLKNYEYRYYQYYRQLVRTNKSIPVPTALSYYHMLDESFHTTISQVIAQDLYKEFPQPTMYERLVSNTIIYRGQLLMLSGLSGVMPATFRDDSTFLQPLYQTLRSSLFEMSHQDALHWLEKCVCHEHEGFHLNIKYHERLLSNMRQAFHSLDYLWPVNRELGVMASGTCLNKILKNNRQNFIRFAQRIEADFD